jgi:hypothetical protein
MLPVRDSRRTLLEITFFTLYFKVLLGSSRVGTAMAAMLML